jgi:hypothetical protein
MHLRRTATARRIALSVSVHKLRVETGDLVSLIAIQ